MSGLVRGVLDPLLAVRVGTGASRGFRVGIGKFHVGSRRRD